VVEELEGSTAEAEPEAEVEAEAENAELEVGSTDDQDESRPSVEAVGALFARLKAGKEPVAPGAAPAESEPVTPAPVAVAEPAEAIEEPGEAEPPDARAALVARRDATLAPATKSLNRHLKRLLADEQNELLDRLRRQGGKGALPVPAEHDGAWAEAASSELALAAAAGAAFPAVGGSPRQPSPDDLVAVAEALAEAVASPLRDRLSQVIEEADGDAEVAADGIRATYRTWRSERLGPAIDHAVVDAFSLGVATAFGAGAPVVWLVDDAAQACPDCADNALAGALPDGEAFPTGHRRPPAHPGCRCLLVAPGDPALTPA
jgi:hypothetical protein